MTLVSASGLSGTSTLTATGILSGSTMLNYTITTRTSQPFSGAVSNTAHLSGDGSLRNLDAPLVDVVNRLRLPLIQRP